MTVDFLAHIRSESARFGAVLRTCDPSAMVPTCPGWTAQDLLAHLVRVQTFWTTIVRDRLDDPAVAEAAENDVPTGYDALLDESERTAAELVRVLDETSDDVEVWTWSTDHTVGFVRRRQAHEALIHRVDAEMTADIVTAFDPELALDGIDEAIRIMFGNQPAWTTWTASGVCGEVRVGGTDAAWRFRIGTLSGVHPKTGTSYTDEPAIELDDTVEPAFSISGSAADLDAWLWNRPTWGELEIDGDHAAFERFRAVVSDGIE